MQSFFKKIFLVFLYLFVFCLPFQVNAMVFSQPVFSSGFFNPYVSHFIYLSDLFLLLSVVALSFHIFFHKNNFKFTFGDKRISIPLLLFGLSFVISFFFSYDLINSVFYFLRFLEFFVVYLLFVNKFVEVKTFLTVFIYSMFLQSLIGISQYVLQESLGARFIGEPVISSSALGVAKIDVFSFKYLRIYGTFPHPNIFAGYLLFALILLPVSSIWKTRRTISYLLAFLFVTALFLTFSRSAYLALLLVLVYGLYTYRKSLPVIRLFKFFSIIFIFAFFFGFLSLILSRLLNLDLSSIFERLRYILVSFKMFFDNPFGVGAGNFTLAMQNYDNILFLPWLFQPVHNVFLLVLNELGVFGFGTFVILLVSFVLFSLKRPMRIRFILVSLMISVVTIGLYDHYFISLYHGQALFWFMLWMKVL